MSTRRTSAYSFRWHRLLCSELLVLFAVQKFSGVTGILTQAWRNFALHGRAFPLLSLQFMLLDGTLAAAAVFLGCHALLVRRQLEGFQPEGVDRLRSLGLINAAVDVCVRVIRSTMFGTPISLWLTVLRAASSLMILPIAEATRCYYRGHRLRLRGPITMKDRRAPLLMRLLLPIALLGSLYCLEQEACTLFVCLLTFLSHTVLSQEAVLLRGMTLCLCVCTAEMCALLYGFCLLDRLEKRGLRIVLIALWAGVAALAGVYSLLLLPTYPTFFDLLSKMVQFQPKTLLLLPVRLSPVLYLAFGGRRRTALA